MNLHPDYRLAREKMVRSQLISRGIKDARVLSAMGKVPRDRFVEEALVGEAYNDHPLPIGHKQTISQPYMVALMTEALMLTGSEKVLEIGTEADIRQRCWRNWPKRFTPLKESGTLMVRARTILAELACNNVLFKAYDGTLGWREFAPYEAIMVTAGAPGIPEPLLEQLAEGGRLVIPVGDRTSQDLKRITKKNGKYLEKSLGGCRFVNLIGVHGWEV